MEGKLLRFKKNFIYLIEFYDHSIMGESDNVIKCEAIGRIEKDSDVQVVLSCWSVLNGSESTRASNKEKISIVKSCIIKRRLLK